MIEVGVESTPAADRLPEPRHQLRTRRVVARVFDDGNSRCLEAWRILGLRDDQVRMHGVDDAQRFRNVDRGSDGEAALTQDRLRLALGFASAPDHEHEGSEAVAIVRSPPASGGLPPIRLCASF
jgi:hypothetical protein